jgi:hypothetical protein
MKALLRKELREQLPFLLLVAFLVVLNIVEHALGKFPDQKSLSGFLNEHSAEGGAISGMVYLVLAMSLALALLPRERDEGTLEFLDALPCTRGRVFMSKVLTGMIILGLYPLLDNTTGLIIHRLARSSLDPEWPMQIVIAMMLIEASVLFSLLGVALALSYFRRFAFLVLGIIISVYLVLSAVQLPWIHLLDFTETLRYTFREGRLDVEWRSLSVTAVIGLMGYVTAGAVFRFQGDRATRMLGALERNHLKGPLAVAGTIAMVVVWLIVIGVFAYSQAQKDGEIGEEPRVTYRSWQTSQLRSGGYVFLYPSNLRSRATALAEEAGEVHRKVYKYLGAEPVGEIVADLNSELRHVAGTAEWKRINMSIAETEELSEQIAILGHETTHVYINSLSNGRLSRAFHHARWWHEGLASFVEFQLFRPPGEVAQIQRTAAAAHRKKASDFELLVDDSAWRIKHDPDLAYSLGEVFFEGFVEEHGPTAPAQILRAMDRPDAPEGIAGLDLWRDAFQACGWDLSTSVAGYYRRLHELSETTHKEFVDSLPKLRGRVLTEKSDVTIQVVLTGDLPAEAELRCRVRRSAADSDAEMFYIWESEGRRFDIRRGWIGDGEFWYQLGIDHPNAQFTVYEDWQRARVR